MIGTLFVQELRSTWRPLLTALGITLFVAAISLVTCALRVPVVGGLGLVLGILLIIAITPLALGILIENYWRTMYGREGYFTMSLPVRGRSIFAAKVLFGLAAAAIAACVTVLSAAGASVAYGLSQGLGAFEILNDVLSSVDPSTVWFLIGALALQLIFTVIMGAAVMSIGAEARFSHLGFGAPVIGAVIVYFAMQVLGITAMLFIPLGLTIEGPGVGGFVAKGMLDDFIATVSDPTGQTQPTVIGLGIIFVSVAGSILLAWWGSRSVDRHTSLR